VDTSWPLPPAGAAEVARREQPAAVVPVALFVAAALAVAVAAVRCELLVVVAQPEQLAAAVV
jgi:hypothetical protein